MVLTNFECWAHGGGAVIGSDDLALDSRHVDMFDPRMVQQRLNTATGASSVSHISSNGYYGFSYVNAAHEPTESNSQYNSNDNINNTNMNHNSNNNNNNNRCVSNANDVNGVPLIHHSNNHGNMDVGAIGVDAGVPAATATATFGTQRCKKRYFVSDDDYAKCALLNGYDSGVGAGGLDVCVAAAAKRCRFDEDYAAAQYCNDFFLLPSTQIGTQSCLMDTEDTQQLQLQQQQQQPQVDVNMAAANLTNQTINNTSNIHFITQQQHAEQQQQQQQVINTTQSPPIVVYQQQHNYQAKKLRPAIDYDVSYGNSIVNINLSNNINAANQNSNKLYYKNHDIEGLSGNAPAYPTQNCRERENGDFGIGHNNGVISEVNQNGVYSVVGHTYQLNLERTSTHNKVASNEDSTGTSSIAALYAKTHGGAFYQFTASNSGNQPYVEDI